MDQLTRFVRELGDRLIGYPDGKHGPVSVADIREQVLPYRQHRRRLGLDSVEDYETILLRLVAEEAGHVRTVPEAAAERCREQLSQHNPDLGVLDEISDAIVQILPRGSIDDGFSVPLVTEADRAEYHRSEPDTPTEAEDLELAGDSALCPHCSQSVPEGRAVTFCPWCGKRLTPITCGRCGTELAAAWRHCITCGATQ